jgi:hypothetical protein
MSAATIELAAATDAYCAAEGDLFDLRALILASRTSVFVGPRRNEDELRCAMRRCLGVFAQSAERLAAALDSAATAPLNGGEA